MYQYGKDYEYDAPVKLLVKHLHAMAESPDEQLVVVSQVCISLQTIFLIGFHYSFIFYLFVFFYTLYEQVLVADINIGYEEIVNTQVIKAS